MLEVTPSLYIIRILGLSSLNNYQVIVIAAL